MIAILLLLWGMIGYLACRVAYTQGRKDKWEEMARDYICFHKTVKVKPLIVTVDYEAPKKQVKKQGKKYNKKTLTKKH